jgi:hypothetical protein
VLEHNHDDSGDYHNLSITDKGNGLQSTRVLQDPFTYSRQPSDRTIHAAKESTLSTPRNDFMERLNGRTISLPTPNSRDHASVSNSMACRSQPLESPAASPMPNRFNDKASLSREGGIDLTTTVLELIRSEKIELQASTQMQLCHEIGLKVDVDQAKLRRYEATISELRKRLDELETMILHLTA